MDDNSWLIIASLHYKPGNVHWQNKFGQTVRLANLISTLAATPNLSLPCGGSHKLHALAAARKAIRSGQWPLDSDSRAAATAADHELTQNIAGLQQTQDRYGLLNLLPEVAGERTDPQSLDNAIYFNGHTLEWLCDYGSPELLREEWIDRAVDWLVAALADDNVRARTNIGYTAHAARGLDLYLRATR